VTALLLAAVLAAGGAWAQEIGARVSPLLMSPGGYPIFYSSEGPLSFVTATPRDLPAGAKDAGEVRGRSCQHRVSVPLSASLQATQISAVMGNGGYRKTLAAIQTNRPELAGIYDVKVDVETFSVMLGIYTRLCTEIVARGYKLGP